MCIIIIINLTALRCVLYSWVWKGYLTLTPAYTAYSTLIALRLVPYSGV